MTIRILLAPALLGSALMFAGCAGNYAAEGALAGAAVGAGVGAISDVEIEEGADGRCYRRDRDGREYEVRC